MILWPTLRPLFSSDGAPFHATLIVVSAAWFLAMGLRGIAGMWGYYNDVPISTVVFVVGLIGLAGWAFGLHHLHRAWSKGALHGFFRRGAIHLTPWEFVLSAILSLQFLLYAYTAIIPWLGWDEMVIYGGLAKQIANGWVTQDLEIFSTNTFMFSGDKLGEIVAAQEIYAVMDTYLARGLRVLNLIFVSIGFYGVLRWLGAARPWSLIGISGFLAVPELVWAGTSLKVDIVTMALEISALLLLSVALVSLLPQHRHKVQRRSNLLIVAVALSALAFASRLSGINLLALVGLTAAVFIIWETGSVPSKTLRILALTGIVALCGIGYFVNILDFGNPFYPFQGPWPFGGGDYAVTFEAWEAKVNLLGFPPVIEQFYLLFHLALGIEAWTWKFGITLLPHAKSHAATMLWLSPAMLSIFLVPFFFKRTGSIVILGAVFIYWFTVWSLGFHYSRVFIAGSSVPVLIAAVIVSLNGAMLSKTQLYLRNLLAGGLILILLGFIPFQIYKVFSEYPHMNPFGGSEARHKANVEALKKHPNFRKFTEYPSLVEAEAISDILGSYSKALVHTDRPEAFHILFENGNFIGTNFGDPGRLQLRDEADCILLARDSVFSEEQRTIARLAFTDVKFTSSSNDWQLRCRHVG